MARDAGCAERCELVVGMAAGAIHRRVLSGQGEFGGVMVEDGAIPIHRCVALRAILREAGRHVVRVVRAPHVRQMAADTGRAEGRVLIVNVANGADDGGVLAGQRKLGAVVVERRVVPVDGGMAQ